MATLRTKILLPHSKRGNLGKTVARAINPAKLSPEAQSNHTIPRPRLYDQLAGGLQLRATVIAAAAGYGKSTLLSSFCSNLVWPAVWYRLHEDDADPARFLLHLAEGFRRKAVYLDHVDCHLPLDQLSHSYQTVLANLTAQLADVPRDCRVVLVLDDYHTISHSPAIIEILDYILTYLPENFHIFISSRCSVATPQLARLRQYGEVLDLSEADLIFTKEEVGVLLDRWGICDISEVNMHQIADRSNGWVAALQMICQQIAKRHGYLEEFLVDNLNGSEQPIYDYFALHVVQAQTPAVQRFMERTSFLYQLTPGAANSVLGISNAGEVLDQLHRSHALISYLGIQNGHPVYHYHSLFLDFLQERFRRREGDNAVRELHLASGLFFEKEENWDGAFHHFYKGHHWSVASRIIQLRGASLISIGHLTTLSDWLGRIPINILENDPWLLLTRGRILDLKGKLEQASVSLQEAERLFRLGDDRSGISLALFARAAISHKSCWLAEGLRLLEEALSATVAEDQDLRAEILTYLILGYATCGRFAEAKRSFDDAISLLDRMSDRRLSLLLRIRAMRRLAWARLQQGQIRCALQLAEQTFPLCQAESLDEPTIAHCLQVTALICLVKGDFEKSSSLADRAMDIATRLGLTGLLNKLTGIRADVLAADNHLSDAEGLHKSHDYGPSEMGGLAYVWLRQGQLSEARQACLDDLEQARLSEAPIHAARARALLGVIAMESGNNETAGQDLSSAEDVFTRLQSEYNLAGVRMHLARLCYEQHQFDRGRHYLEQALQFAEREQCFHFFLWLPDTVAYLTAKALRENISSDYVAKLCSRRLSTAQLHFLLPLLSDKESGLRDMATRLVLDIARSGESSPSAAGPLLVACKDEYLRSRIVGALADMRLTAGGLLRLRHVYGLSWREIDIFICYYLPAPYGNDQVMNEGDSQRANLAQSMSLTDNTLRYYINTIRRKLNLLGRKGGISIYQWALGEGIVN